MNDRDPGDEDPTVDLVLVTTPDVSIVIRAPALADRLRRYCPCNPCRLRERERTK
jgi:hypothetical protein